MKIAPFLTTYPQHRVLQQPVIPRQIFIVYQSTTPGGVLPYTGYIGMCRCEGYGFQAVYSRIGYVNQSVWSRIGYHFSGN